MASVALVLAVLLPVLAGLGLVTLAAVVFRSARHLRHSLVFAALYLLSGMKSLAEGLRLVADRFHASSPLFPARLPLEYAVVVCAFLMAPLLLWFVSLFPQPARWIRRRPGAGWLLLAAAPVSVAVVFLAPRHALAYIVAFEMAAVAVTLYAVRRLAATRADAVQDIERRQARYLLVGLLPSFAATWFLVGQDVLLFWGRAVQGDPGYLPPLWRAHDPIVQVYSPVLELLAATAIAFAILKYNALGVELKFKVGVRTAIFGAILAAVFLLTQFVENVVLQGQLFAFAGEYGSFLLSGVTGLVLFKPIEKVSRKASDRLFPDTLQPKADYVAQRADEIYEAQCTYVLRDAQVTERELAFLRNLRAQLGIPDAAARAIEERVERILKVDAPQTGQTTNEPPDLPPSPGRPAVGTAPPTPSAAAAPDGPAGESGPKAS